MQNEYRANQGIELHRLHCTNRKYSTKIQCSTTGIRNGRRLRCYVRVRTPAPRMRRIHSPLVSSSSGVVRVGRVRGSRSRSVRVRPVAPLASNVFVVAHHDSGARASSELRPGRPAPAAGVEGARLRPRAFALALALSPHSVQPQAQLVRLEAWRRDSFRAERVAAADRSGP